MPPMTAKLSAEELAERLLGGIDHHGCYNGNIEYIKAAAAQVREAEALKAWQPIETAPKDGTDVLLLQHGKAVQAHWGGDHHKTWVSTVGLALMFLDSATHWQPLPPPPAQREGRE